MIEYFCCYHSYKKCLQKLTNAEIGELFMALMEYSETGTLTDLDGRVEIAFSFIAEDIDRAKENYAAVCKKRAESAAKGAAARWNKSDQDNSKCNTEMPNMPNGILECQTMPNDAKNAQKENEEEKEEEEKNKEKEKGKKEKFSPPTLQEVIDYAKSRNSSVDPQRFYDYFSAGNWKDAKGNAVKNWKQKLITWENHNNERNNKPASQPDAQWNLAYD